MIKLEELINSVKTLIEVEKNKGIADHGEFHSLHEAYAVVLEEYQEANEELKRAAFALDVAWKEARSNNKDFSLEAMRQAEAYAMLAATECIQFAAMCRKAQLLR